MKKLFLLLVAVVLVFFVFCASKPNKQLVLVKFTGEAQGTYYAISYYTKDSLNLQPQVDSILKQFNFTASSWESKSILSRVNKNEPKVKLNSDFIKLFDAAVAVSEKTNGAFDMTVGPLVNAWGFGLKKRDSITKQLIDSLLPLVNYKNVKLKNNRIYKKYPQIQFDFAGIAQGYTVDILGEYLKSKGIDSFIVDVGGELAAYGRKPNGDQWLVGVEKPTLTADDEREVQAIVWLENKAMSTSGSYRKYYEKNNIRYSHTIDPKTGHPVTHNLLSVSIIAKDCITADAYCTAFMVMGVEKSKAFLAQQNELEAYFISSKKDGTYEIYATEGFKKLIEK